jgi:hypothetical protein
VWQRSCRDSYWRATILQLLPSAIWGQVGASGEPRRTGQWTSVNKLVETVCAKQVVWTFDVIDPRVTVSVLSQVEG